MYKSALVFACLALSATTANAETVEGRVQVLAGSELADEADGFIGAALGADYEIDKHTFIGAEVSVDHALSHHDVPTWRRHLGDTTGSLVGRAGGTFEEVYKVYALAGVKMGSEETVPVYGMGIERKFGSYLASLEYRHVSEVGTDQIAFAIGITF